jgi:hypothetical protein
MMSRKVSESVKKRIAGKQYFKCANEPGKQLIGLEGYECPLWQIEGPRKGTFNEACYEIDHIKEHSITHDDSEPNLQALCLMCHAIKTRRFMSNRSKNKSQSKQTKQKKKFISSSDDEYYNNDCDMFRSDPEFENEPVNCKSNFPIDSESETENSISSECELISNKISITNYIDVPIDCDIWTLSSDFINCTKNNEQIICGYDNIYHRYIIYKFNVKTTLYEQIDSLELIKHIRKFKDIYSDEYAMKIASEVCHLSYIINLYDLMDKSNENCFINGNRDKKNNKIRQRTVNDYHTICKNNYYCCDIGDYISAFYDITGEDNDKISKIYFIDMYNLHNKNDVTWNDLLKDTSKYGLKYKSNGYFVGLKKKNIQIDTTYYDKFAQKYILKTGKKTDKIEKKHLIKLFIEWLGDNIKPTEREILWYFSKNVFGLSSKRGEEFPLCKWEITY